MHRSVTDNIFHGWYTTLNTEINIFATIGFCRRLYCHHKTYFIYRLLFLPPEFKCLICGRVQVILTSNRYFHVSLGLPLWF